MADPRRYAELRVPNTLAKCVTREGCFFARGIDDPDVRRLADSHRQERGHEVSVEVLPRRMGDPERNSVCRDPEACSETGHWRYNRPGSPVRHTFPADPCSSCGREYR